MKEIVKNKIAPKWVRYSSYSLSVVSILAIFLYILTDNMTWIVVFALTGWSFMLTFSILLALLNTNQKPKLTHICFGDTFISVCLGKIVLKRIPYEKIKGATISRAMSPPYLYSYFDQEGKERSILTLYQSDCSFLPGLNSKAGIVCKGYNMNALCYDLAYAEHLPVLLEKTAVYIYITEQMFILHKDVLIQALQSNPDRFFVACFDNVAGEEKKIPYNDYVLNYQ